MVPRSVQIAIFFTAMLFITPAYAQTMLCDELRAVQMELNAIEMDIDTAASNEMMAIQTREALNDQIQALRETQRVAMENYNASINQGNEEYLMMLLDEINIIEQEISMTFSAWNAAYDESQYWKTVGQQLRLLRADRETEAILLLQQIANSGLIC